MGIRFKDPKLLRVITPAVREFRDNFIEYDGVTPQLRSDLHIDDLEDWIDGLVDSTKADSQIDEDELLADFKRRAISALEDL